MKTQSKYTLGFAVLALFFLIIFVSNRILTRQIDELTVKPDTVPAVSTPELAPAAPESGAKRDALRIERWDSQLGQAESVFYINKTEVARYMSKKGRVTGLKGRIPDGKFKFINQEANTYGFEYFENGKRHGPYEEYYGNDQLKKEGEFRNGRLIRRKSFYIDGELRSDEDYTQAGFIVNFLALSDMKEAGVGKLYRPDGSLKYEWYGVDNAPQNYNKTYNKNGEMIEANYFDAQGALTERWEAQKNLP